jgi:hypothetical protein
MPRAHAPGQVRVRDAPRRPTSTSSAGQRDVDALRDPALSAAAGTCATGRSSALAQAVELQGPRGVAVVRAHRQQPRPRMPVRGLRAAGRSTAGLELGRLADEQPQLRRFGRLGHAAGHNFAARVGVGREHAVISQHMEARRRDQSDEPGDEIKGIQHHGVRPISPGVFEPVHPAGTRRVLRGVARACRRAAGDH